MSTFLKLKQTLSSKEDEDHYLDGLDKSKKSFSERIRKLALGSTGINEKFLEGLMVILLEADISVKTAQKIVDEAEGHAVDQELKSFDGISERPIEVMHELYASVENEDFRKNEDGPMVILVVGVGSSGRTITTVKLTKLFQSEGNSAVPAVADIFRTGVIDQLAKWADRLGVTCVRGREDGDPSAVPVDACRYAGEHGMDCLIRDTAGRLQNGIDLVQELSEMRRAIEREIPGAPHEVWPVLDIITGQNGILQARTFLETTKINDIVLTRMDGTAKGGIITVIRDLLEPPVKYTGLDEKEDDLRPFDIDSYLCGLCEDILQRD